MAHTSVGFQCRSATPSSSHRIRGLKPAATILDRYAVDMGQDFADRYAVEEPALPGRVPSISVEQPSLFLPR